MLPDSCHQMPEDGERRSVKRCGRDVEKARTAVSMIVGRDTAVLSEEGIIKAAVETVAENTSDGSIYPLCSFSCLAGLLQVLHIRQ